MPDMKFEYNDEGRTSRLHRYMQMQAEAAGVSVLLIQRVDQQMQSWGYDLRMFSRLVAKQGNNYLFDYQPRGGYTYDRLLLLVDQEGNLIKYSLQAGAIDQNYHDQIKSSRFNKTNSPDYYLPGVPHEKKGQVSTPFSWEDQVDFRGHGYNSEEHLIGNYVRNS